MSDPESSRSEAGPDVAARPSLAALAVLAGVVALAVVESANALVAPGRAPSPADWQAVATDVRAGFRSGDLVVAAPAWADPVMRQHLGDLTPPAVAGRMDAARFGRIWEIGERGATAPEAVGARLVETHRHGALTLRLLETEALPVRYDFVAHGADAQVRVEGGGAAPAPVPPGGLRARTAEVDATLRRALVISATGGTLVVEFPAALLGRELAVGTGLANVWSRKGGEGVVEVRVLIDGQPVATTLAGNETGWRVVRADTAALAGRTLPVRFEIRCADPRSRELALAAEARG